MRTKYDIFTHKTGVRIVGADSGRRGLVIEIKETRPEWIEPIIKWDDGKVSKVQNESIYLEEGE